MGVDLVNHVIAERIGKGGKRGRGTAPQIDPGNNIAGLELVDLCTQYGYRVIIQEFFALPAGRYLTRRIRGGPID